MLRKQQAFGNKSFFVVIRRESVRINGYCIKKICERENYNNRSFRKNGL